jgi:hypothetical protein
MPEEKLIRALGENLENMMRRLGHYGEDLIDKR